VSNFEDEINFLPNITLPSPFSRNYLQVVYAITSQQKHTLTDKTTKEVVGGSKAPETLTVYWGFEKHLENPDSPWILVDRLTRK